MILLHFLKKFLIHWAKCRLSDNGGDRVLEMNFCNNIKGFTLIDFGSRLFLFFHLPTTSRDRRQSTDCLSGWCFHFIGSFLPHPGRVSLKSSAGSLPRRSSMVSFPPAGRIQRPVIAMCNRVLFPRLGLSRDRPSEATLGRRFAS